MSIRDTRIRVLAGFLFAACGLLLMAGASAGEKIPRRLSITVSEDGFSPKRLTVKKGEVVTLVFTRRTDRTCAKEVIIYIGDTNTVARSLPLNTPVEVTVSFPKSGERGFSCAMRMHGGAIMVE